MFPWFSFGAFLFQATEQPIFGSDTDWVNTPTISRQRPLGATADAILSLGIGSADRTWEAYFTPDRFTSLLPSLSTSALLTDWRRPTPDSRSAVLVGLEQVEADDIAVQSAYATTQRRIRARLSFVSQ